MGIRRVYHPRSMSTPQKRTRKIRADGELQESQEPRRVLVPALWLLGGLLRGLPFYVDALEPLVWLAPIPWLVALQLSTRHAFRWGWFGGFVYIGLGVSWLGTIHPAAVIGTAAYFALFIGLWAVLSGPVAKSRGLPLWVAAPLAIWTSEALIQHASLFKSTFLTQGSAAWRWTWFVQVAEIGGVQFLSALITLLAAGLHHLGSAWHREGRAGLRQRAAWLPLMVGVGAVAASLLFGAWRVGTMELSAGPKVALVQGGIPQSRRLDPSQTAAVTWEHVALTLRARNEGVDLVTWPESTSGYFLEAQPEIVAMLGQCAQVMGAPIAVGAIGLNPDHDPPIPSNSAFLVNEAGQLVARQDKRFLLPGGETLLFLDHVPALRDPISDYLSRSMGFRPFLKAGTESIPWTIGDLQVGVTICYDDVLHRPMQELQSRGADIVLNLSNEAWFGDTELDQHLALASIQSVQTRLSLARATNTGVTCIIDPAGRVLQQLPRNAPGVLVGQVPLSDVQPFPAWLRHGLSLLVCTLMLGLALWHAAAAWSARPREADRPSPAEQVSRSRAHRSPAIPDSRSGPKGASGADSQGPRSDS